MINKPKIIFAGTPEFAVPALEKINLAGFEIKLVLTQPDRKSGRGMNVRKSPVKEKSIELDIPVYQPEVLTNNKEALNSITSKKADGDSSFCCWMCCMINSTLSSFEDPI